jgi:hypothetical protein
MMIDIMRKPSVCLINLSAQDSLDRHYVAYDKSGQKRFEITVANSGYGSHCAHTACTKAGFRPVQTEWTIKLATKILKSITR